MRRIALFMFGLLSTLWAASASAQAPGAGSFDGTWAVVLVCPQSPDGALPFTFRFTSEIRGGVLHGQYGTLGTSPSMSLDGHVQPDGTAQLLARGLTGTPAYNISQAPRAAPFEHDVTARFNAAQGAGAWVAVRTCNFTFTKQ